MTEWGNYFTVIPSRTTLSVAQLVRSIKNTLENSLGSLWVEGEISNYKLQSSGHAYFTLKDESAQISCVFFKGAAARCFVRPDNGLKVKIYAEVGIYEPRGQVQLIVKVMEDAGRGSLQQQFEALKKKLREEGLFDSERKKAIPGFPERIGIITSPTGAVIQDIQHVFERRAPWIQLYLYPVRVQGEGAATEITQAITLWNQPSKEMPEVDLLIVGRGGGSLEDLWSFNEECVARAIAASALPVISAVGHETDFTIADFVADMRAPTPTAAAELASPDGPAIERRLLNMWQLARSTMGRTLENHELRLNIYKRGVLSTSPEKVLRDYIQLVDEQESHLLYTTEETIRSVQNNLHNLKLQLLATNPEKVMEWNKQSLDRLTLLFRQSSAMLVQQANSRLCENEKLLTALSPQSAFKRGYAVVKNSGGLIVRDPKTLQRGETLDITIEKGSFEAEAR